MRKLLAILLALFLLLPTIALPVQAQEPITSLVDYPSSAKTDLARLYAIYSLLEQVRVDYNSNLQEAHNKGVCVDYWLKYKEYVKPLLAERSRLREGIKKANYTVEQWSKLRYEERDLAFLVMFGNKEIEKVKPVLATS